MPDILLRKNTTTGRGRPVVILSKYMGLLYGTLYDWFEDGSANIFVTDGSDPNTFMTVAADQWRFEDDHEEK